MSMDITNTITQFASLFQGRLDAYGTNAGGCDKQTDGTYEEYLKRVTQHLYGDQPMGVYPLFDDSTVRWGCVDFDEGEQASFDHARNLKACLATFDIKGWVERSRSKGYHVWCFWPHPQDALTVRRALLAACQIVDAPTKEINPKQTVVADGQVGNYVRLPYPCGASERQVMVDHDGQPAPLAMFLDYAPLLYSSEALLQELAVLYEPPRRAVVTVQRASSDDLEEILGRVSPKTLRMIRNPVAGENVDRSRQLFVIGRRLADEQMLTRGEIEAVLRYADTFLGKYGDRHDADLRFSEIVGKVCG